MAVVMIKTNLCWEDPTAEGKQPAPVALRLQTPTPSAMPASPRAEASGCDRRPMKPRHSQLCDFFLCLCPWNLWGKPAAMLLCWHQSRIWLTIPPAKGKPQPSRQCRIRTMKLSLLLTLDPKTLCEIIFTINSLCLG